MGRNVRTHNYDAHGALVIDLRTGEKVNFYHTEGPLQAIAISDDGQYLGGIEVPAVTPQGKIIGAHRLHIWNRAKEK
ncbi:PQQ enzyme repeat domain protein [gut metagenome]|uniref:PQQ enzyme repeat domain protein n=1 Tax=gut metagenome TaxID=749906 RepID=J9C5E9_9ZZZZ